MQILSATKDTKETLQEKLQETLNKKRNLFGLGVTSLIAACSGADKAAGGGGGEKTPPLPFTAEALSGTKADGKSGFTAARGGDADQFTFEVKEAETTKATLIFTDGTNADSNLIPKAEIYKLTATEGQYDLVISSANIDTEAGLDTQEGRIFIFWNVADIKDETIGKGVTTATIINNYLEVKGAYRGDLIGTHAPEFLQIGGTDNNYDMVIRSEQIDGYKGGIYILWDVADYAGKNKTIDLGTLDQDDSNTSLGEGATSGSLAIYGAKGRDLIGTHAPEFLQIGGKADNYDMVIRSEYVDKVGNGSEGSNTNEGAIYILWDVTDYAGNKAIDLGKLSEVDSEFRATAGSLAIYGAKERDLIGSNAPEFLQIGGKADNYDMVIRSEYVDKVGNGSEGSNTNEGAIYILWDVADYAGNKAIDLGKLSEVDSEFRATAGSLAIYGNRTDDNIGAHAPEFLQIGGKANNHDMVISSQYINHGPTNTGAIYILWDVADYTGTNKLIDLNATYNNTSNYASSGLLTIYGRNDSDFLGSDANNILYGSDDDGNKTLTNIDGDTAGTKDIAITDSMYTYIFFGDKIATTTGTGDDEKVDSKVIDLAVVNASFTANSAAAGFFNYDFDGSEAESVPEVARVGYRFAENDIKANLAEVQTAYTTATSTNLSDADADLGVWDIA